MESIMTIADIGYDSAFAIGSGEPLTYTPVAEVVSITPPGMSRDAIEATHLKSPGGWKEFIAGMKDGGEASFTLNWAPSATDALVTAFNADSGNYQITFPNGVMLRFAGFFTAYTPPDLTAEKMEASVTVKVSGAVTLHAV
jgi:predicted secreted protein